MEEGSERGKTTTYQYMDHLEFTESDVLYQLSHACYFHLQVKQNDIDKCSLGYDRWTFRIKKFNNLRCFPEFCSSILENFGACLFSLCFHRWKSCENSYYGVTSVVYDITKCSR